jgi:hypothetical protein
MGANNPIEDFEATLLAATKSALDELVWWAHATMAAKVWVTPASKPLPTRNSVTFFASFSTKASWIESCAYTPPHSIAAGPGLQRIMYIREGVFSLNVGFDCDRAFPRMVAADG